MSKAKPIHLLNEGFSDELFEVQKKNIRLLVVDDSLSFARAIQDHAELFAFQCAIDCRSAVSESEASDIIKSWSPNCVLLHLHLDQGNAFAMLRRWRDSLMTLVAVADQHSAFIEEAARTGGADAFYARTDNPEELLQLLEEVVAHVPEAPTVH